MCVQPGTSLTLFTLRLRSDAQPRTRRSKAQETQGGIDHPQVSSAKAHDVAASLQFGDADEADRDPMPIVAKRHGISEQTIYTWRKRFGTFQADDVRRLKQLEAENARLKKLVAERDLDTLDSRFRARVA
jgi:transposase-like protein